MEPRQRSAAALGRHTEEIGRTLAPEYGPESPGEAMDRLLDYYQRLGPEERYAFVAALVSEVVTFKALVRRVREVARSRRGEHGPAGEAA